MTNGHTALGFIVKYRSCKLTFFHFHFHFHFPACSPSNTNIAIDAEVPGEISTPVFPDGSSDSSCIWKIQAPENFRLEITIKALKLNGADDYLIIRDGTKAGSSVIGRYGSCVSGSLTLFSSGSSVSLETVSAVFSVNDKLKIAYRPIDPGKSARLLLGASLIVTYYSIREKLTQN